VCRPRDARIRTAKHHHRKHVGTRDKTGDVRRGAERDLLLAAQTHYLHAYGEKHMLTIAEVYSYFKTSTNSLRRFIGMNPPKTVLICFCHRCGYGRTDHPKTVGKPWVVMARPRLCEGCGSAYWDVPRRKARRPLNLAPGVSAKSAIGGGTGISVSKLDGARRNRVSV